MINNISEAYAFLEKNFNLETQRKKLPFDVTLNVERIKELLAHVGNPEKELKFIHIAGTKGKGSVANIISYVLSEYGFNVGLYTSPHIFSPLERIQVNNIPISEKSFVEYCQKLQSVIDKISFKPTYFELMTTISVLHFYNSKCDYVVFETGLGGRLDSTNFCKPILTIIAKIGLDHQHILGNTIEEITYEKAGIIKNSVPVVVSNNIPLVEDIIKESSMSKNCPIFIYNKDYQINDIKIDFTGTELKYSSQQQKASKISTARFFIPLIGKHQADNLASSLKALEIILKDSFDNIIINRALKKVFLSGRMQIIKIKEKTIILDVAHNIDSINALCSNIRLLFENTSKEVCFFCNPDKDYKKMLNELLTISKIFHLTTPFNSEQYFSHVDTLNDYLENKAEHVEVEYNIMEIINNFINFSKNEVLIVTGSFYLVGKVLNELSI